MQTYTFREISEMWLNSATIGVGYSWSIHLKSMVKHLNSSLSNMDINKIKPRDLELIVKQLSERNPNTNRPSSKRLLKAIVNVSNQVFEFAVENEYALRNPASKLSKKIPRNAPTKEVTAISDNQKALIMEFDHKTKIAAVIMMFMGLRRGELLSLEWKDFDFENNILSVNKSCKLIENNRFVVKPGTKNGKSRQVPIPATIAPWLENQKMMADSLLVIPNKNGELLTPTQWRGKWRTYQNDLNYFVYVRRCNELNITPKNKYSPTGVPDMNMRFNVHQLRHTYATMLYLSGVDILTAKELLGHSDVKITLNIYTHLEQNCKKLNIIKFDQYIQSELLNAASL